MSSNVTAMRCTPDEVFIQAANGATWTITRTQVMAIWQSKGGNPAAKKAATLTDVLASATAALGSYFDSLLASFDFDTADLTKSMLLAVS